MYIAYTVKPVNKGHHKETCGLYAELAFIQGYLNIDHVTTKSGRCLKSGLIYHGH